MIRTAAAFAVVAAALTAVRGAAIGAPAPPHTVEPAEGSPRGYVVIRDNRIRRGATLEFVDASPESNLVPIRQRVVRGRSRVGVLTAALVGLEAGKPYDVVVRMAGEDPIVGESAFLAKEPTDFSFEGDGRGGSGESIRLLSDPLARKVSVFVGGRRCRVLDGPWTFDAGHVDRSAGTTFRLPRLRAGTAAVTLRDASGWSAEAGQIEILEKRRFVSFSCEGRRVESLFVSGDTSGGFLTIDSTAPWGSRRYGSFDFSVPADLATLELPATFTQATPGAAVEVDCDGPGGQWIWLGGTFTVVVERIDGQDVVGRFEGRLASERDARQRIQITDGRFRVRLFP
jgi:hypothetical protein